MNKYIRTNIMNVVTVGIIRQHLPWVRKLDIKPVL